MSKISLNLRNFKHVKSDNQTTTVQHKNGGHTLTIMHNAVSPEMQTQLKALQGISKEYQTPIQADALHHNKIAKGGSISRDATHGVNTTGYEKGVNRNTEYREHDKASLGQSDAGEFNRLSKAGHAKSSDSIKEHKKTLQEMQSMPNPNLKGLARGGAVHEMPDSGVQDAIVGFADGTTDVDTSDKVAVPGPASPNTTSTGKTPKENMQDMKAGKEESGGVPKDSPLKTGNWSIWADGGQVPTPSQTQTTSTPQPIKKNEVDSTGGWSGAVSNLTHPWAEGGKVARYCAYCGGMAHGGECMAEGGRIDKINSETMLPEQVDKPENKLDYKQIRKEKRAMNVKEANQPIKPRKMYADGTDQVSDSNAEVPGWIAEMQAQNPSQPLPQTPGFEKPDPEKAVIGPATAQARQAAGNWLMATDQGPADPVGVNAADITATKADAVAGGLAQKQQAAEKVADVAHQQAAAQPQPQSQDPFDPTQYNAGVTEAAGIQQAQLTHQIQARQQAIETYKNSYQELDQERQDHIHDIQQGYIDPEKYWQDHSKVASGIGMILAGFNPTNSPNAAIGFLNNQINRSIDAQKANLDSKNNLLKANLQHFGDLHSATMMTQAMMNDALGQQLQQAALNAKNPIAKQAALGAQATAMQQAMQFQQSLAMRQSMIRLANGAGTPDSQGQAIAMMTAVNPEAAKSYREAFVPGVGLSKSLTPVPEAVRQQIVSGEKLQNASQDLLNYSKTHTNINPLSAEYKVGVTKAMILQQMIREGLLGTVFRESEKPLLQSFVSENPANVLKKYNSDPKLRTLLDSSVSQLNTLKHTYDLPTTQPVDQNTMARQWAQQHPSDPRSAKILQKLGN